MKLQLKRSLRVLTSDSLTAQPPSVAQMEFGEIAINYASSDPTIFIKDSNNVIQKLQFLAVPDVTPGTTLDDRYVNVDGDVMTGNLTAPKFLGGVAQVLATAPVTAVEGEQYWDTSDNRLYIYNGSAWVDASPATTNLDDLYYRKAPSDERFVVKTATSTQQIHNRVEIADKIFLNTDGTSVFKGEMTLHADILPAEDNVHSLGSPTKMWKDVYIGPGSLYLNGTRILHEDDSENLVLSADSGQNVIFQPTGDGDLELNPEGTGVVAVKAPLTLYAGYSFNSSDGNAIKFANDISVGQITSDIDGGDLVLTGAGTGKVKIIDIAEATQFVKTGGASTEFLKADGSVDTNTYATTQQLATEGSDRTSAISAAISTEVTDRNSAIASAIAQEVTDRNTAIDAVSGTYVDSTGDTMTGLLVLSDHPTLASDDKQAATKKYADDLIAPYNLGQIATNQGEISTLSTTKMAKAGGNFTGNVTVGASDKMKFQTDGVAIFGNNTTGVKVDSTGAITGTKGTNVNYSVDGDGAATFVSVSAASVDTTGNVTIGGDLIVNGTTTTINTTDLDVTDKMIVVGKGQSDAAAAGSGITVDGANVEWKYDGNNWQTGVGAGFTGAVYVGGTTELTSSIQLKADGSASFDGKISTSVAPTSDSNLTNKLYVDTAVSDEATARTAAISVEETARIAGDTNLQTAITNLTNGAVASNTADIATETAARQAADALLLPLAGGTMSGSINMGGSQTVYVSNNSAGFNAGDESGWVADANAETAPAVDSGNLKLSGPNAYKVFSVTPGVEYTVDAVVSNSNSAFARFDLKDGGVESLAASAVASSGLLFNTSTISLTITPSGNEMMINVSNHGATNTFVELESLSIGAAGSASASTIGVDGSASFGGLVSAATAPTADAHLVNKLYADNLVAGVDLTGIATNAAAIADETTARTNADTTLQSNIDAEEAARIAADNTLTTNLAQEVTDRTAAVAAEATARTAAISTALTDYDTSAEVDNKISDFITVPVLMTSSVPDANSYSEGTLWYNRNDGQLYILLEDADSKQWVEANAPRLSN
jgi:hypothetical protein